MQDFRPLAGFWFLNKIKMKVQISFRADFRPLAGFWFLNTHGLAGKPSMWEDFRPLAGFWFLNIEKGWIRDHDKGTEFPSPCGVLVLKSIINARRDGG